MQCKGRGAFFRQRGSYLLQKGLLRVWTLYLYTAMAELPTTVWIPTLCEKTIIPEATSWKTRWNNVQPSHINSHIASRAQWTVIVSVSLSPPIPSRWVILVPMSWEREDPYHWAPPPFLPAARCNSLLEHAKNKNKNSFLIWPLLNQVTHQMFTDREKCW